MKGACTQFIPMFDGYFGLKGHNTQHSGHTGQIFRNESTVEIYSKSQVGALGKVLRMKFS